MQRVALVVLVFLALAGPARAGGPGLLVGAAEDLVKQPDLVRAKAELDLAKLAGLDAIRITEIWAPGETAPASAALAVDSNVVDAASLDGVRVFASVLPYGSRTTPLTDTEQSEFASYAAAFARALPAIRDVIVGNEPNLNRYWLPQFGPNGEDVAAPAYEQLLARTYDAIKAASPATRVWGGAVSPRGVDLPHTGRDTHSPTAFITDVGSAYRASGRTVPIMDGFAFHPYMESSSTPPTFAHPDSSTIELADYGKLVSLLAAAFDGTAQPGGTLPILYDEFGVESRIPAAKALLYTGAEPATTKPVTEPTQARYYRQALQLAFCQPNVQGIFVFHLVDEPGLAQWQSGVYYADGTPKESRSGVRAAALAVRRGSLAHCDWLHLPVTAVAVGLAGPRPSFRLTCDYDCAFTARLQRAGRTVATTSGRATGGVAQVVRFPSAGAGTYRVAVTTVATVNPAAPRTVVSPPFRAG